MKKSVLIIVSVVSTLLIIFGALYITESVMVGNKLEEIVLDSNSGFIHRKANKNKNIISEELYEDIYVVTSEPDDFNKNKVDVENIKLDFKMKRSLSINKITSGEFRYKMMFRLNAKNGESLEGAGTEEEMVDCIIYWEYDFFNGLRVTGSDIKWNGNKD